MAGNAQLATLLTLGAGSLGFGESIIGPVQSGDPIGSLMGRLVQLL